VTVHLIHPRYSSLVQCKKCTVTVIHRNPQLEARPLGLLCRFWLVRKEMCKKRTLTHFRSLTQCKIFL